jgi:hypothetical protein
LIKTKVGVQPSRAPGDGQSVLGRERVAGVGDLLSRRVTFLLGRVTLLLRRVTFWPGA